MVKVVVVQLQDLCAERRTVNGDHYCSVIGSPLSYKVHEGGSTDTDKEVMWKFAPAMLCFFLRL